MVGGSAKMLLLLSNGLTVPKLVAKWRSVTARERSSLSISRELFALICMLAGRRNLWDCGTLSRLVDSSRLGVEEERLRVKVATESFGGYATSVGGEARKALWRSADECRFEKSE
jgi:hypothetical protein